MSKYEDHEHVINALGKSQDDDQDNRDAAREAHLFVDKEDGQWEPLWWNANEGNPRYTFDMTGPMVDIIAGGMEQQDFSISVRPAGGDVTKDDAKILDGIIRNIENISGANDIYTTAGRNMVTGGIDGWQIKQEYTDDDSFDQDLLIKRVPNFIDSVWFGPFTEPDASDAPWVVVLEAMSKEAYEEKYPDGSGKSVADGRSETAYFYKAEQVVIGNIYYFTTEEKELLLMTSGRVIEAEDVEPALDELEAPGDTVRERRKRSKKTVVSRLFDGGTWLNDAQDTVFKHLPVVPTFGNFKVFENKILYRGVVKKLMDPQRVFNYTKSREVEENALSPRGKYWMTKKQAQGHTAELATLNTNADPVQFYNADPSAPGAPLQQLGGQVNPGLAVLAADMQGVMERTAGRFAASIGDNPGLQSGVAIKALQSRGELGSIKFTTAQEMAICRTAKILIAAIPATYTGERQQRLLKEGGGEETVTLNQEVQDEQTKRMITINDLSRGKYDVVCKAGPSFQNKQQETVSALTEISQIDPSALQIGGDILFNNMSSPGMELLAERKRLQLFNSGVIPEEQLTDEEKEKLAAIQQQPKEPTPEERIAAAQEGLAQAEIGKVEKTGDKLEVDAAVAQRKEDRADAEALHRMESEDKKFDFEQFMTVQNDQITQQKEIAATLKLIREAMGAETVTGPSVIRAFAETSNQLEDKVTGNETLGDPHLP